MIDKFRSARLAPHKIISANDLAIKQAAHALAGFCSAIARDGSNRCKPCIKKTLVFNASENFAQLQWGRRLLRKLRSQVLQGFRELRIFRRSRRGWIFGRRFTHGIALSLSTQDVRELAICERDLEARIGAHTPGVAGRGFTAPVDVAAIGSPVGGNGQPQFAFAPF
jgi:hypothetical protein